MNYEKKYKEAIERAKRRFSEEDLKYLFPELMENEDERIRKAIGYAIGQSTHSDGTLIDGVSSEEALAWLEEQGEQKSTESQKDYYNIDPHFGKPIDFKAKNFYVSKVDGKIHDMTYNTADKVESKFKVGDWIANGRYTKLIVGISSDWPLYVFKDGTAECIKDIDKKYHLWTIQDAKDGDILTSINFHSNCTFIFNGLDNWKFDEPNGDRAVATGYCCLSASADKMEFSTQGPDCIEVDTVKPATKEQHELLFQKMKEVGYEWDDSTKELKKINSYCQENCKGYQETGKCFADGGCNAYHKAEQKPTTWSEEDKEMIECLRNCLDELEKEQGWLYIYINNKDVKLNKVRNWLKSLKDRIQPKAELTQLDKNILEAAIAFVEQNNHFNYWGGVDKHTVLSALRSLKPKKQ